MNLRRQWESFKSSSSAKLLLWCIPALIACSILRLWLMQGWSGGFYYGPDSSTYWHPVLRFYSGEKFQISPKRPWLYPTLMLLSHWGPKSPAYTAALMQHVFGLAGIIPLAAVLRHLTSRWRWWVIPCTMIYAVHPQLLYWEHVLIADSVFTMVVLCGVWAFCWFWRSPKWSLLALAFSLFFSAMAVRPPGRALWLCALPLLLLIPKLTWKQRFARLLPA